MLGHYFPPGYCSRCQPQSIHRKKCEPQCCSQAAARTIDVHVYVLMYTYPLSFIVLLIKEIIVFTKAANRENKMQEHQGTGIHSTNCCYICTFEFILTLPASEYNLQFLPGLLEELACHQVTSEQQSNSLIYFESTFSDHQ